MAKYLNLAGLTKYDEKIGKLASLATTDKSDIVSAINEVANASHGDAASKTVYITETPGSSSSAYSKRYGVYQGSTGSTASPVAGEKLVDIDIPKDMVIESGSVGTVTVADEPYAGAEVGDKYIDLVIANTSSDHIYIPANSLVDIYTAEQSATQIQLVIDSNNEISATVVAGSITSTELAANAVATAKIADGAVTRDKLASAVQSAIDAAGTALQASDFSTGTTPGAIMIQSSILPVAGLANVATSGSSSDVSYDNTTSGLTATTVKTAIDELKGDIAAVDPSAAIQTAIEALDGSATIASKSGDVVTLKAGITEADGIVDNSTGLDITLAAVASTGDAEDVSVADSDSNFSSQTKNVETVLAEIAEHLTWRSV